MAHKQCDTVVGKRVVTDQQNEFGEMRNEVRLDHPQISISLGGTLNISVISSRGAWISCFWGL